MLSVIGAVCLLWFVIANPSSIVAQDTAPAVLDTAGQPLESGTPYYILPSGSTSGGGVTLVSRNRPCPLFVGQENTADSAGLPVIFTPLSAAETTIRESQGFTIRFDASTTCVQSTEWALESNPASTQRTLITTRGGNMSALPLRIDIDGNGYKLVFCPPTMVRPRCGEVGVYVENGKRLLALYESPALPVVFRRA